MDAEKEKLKTELLKMKKQGMIFLLFGYIPMCLTFIVSGIVAAIKTKSDTATPFFFVFLGVAAVFFVFMVIATPFEIKHTKKTRELVDKFAGPVTDADKELARTLAAKWKPYYPDIKKWTFDFMGDQDFEHFAQTITYILREIELGIKSETVGAHNRFLEIIKNSFVELQNKNELYDRTKEIVKIIFEVLDLMERNSYSLTEEQ